MKEKGIEKIYYRMWSKESQSMYENKHLVSDDKYLFAVNIEENNKLFLEELDLIIVKRCDAVDYWLRGLISGYVKNLSAKSDSGNDLSYYTNWLNNTKMVTTDKYPAIYDWCVDYEKNIINR